MNTTINQLLARLAATVLLLASSLYFLLWLVNLKDEAPSAESVRLANILAARQVIPDAQNGFVFYVKYLTSAQSEHQSGLSSQSLFDFEVFNRLTQCKPDRCLATLQDAGAELADLIVQQQAELAAYQRILTFSDWQYPVMEAKSSFLPIGPLIQMQQLFLLNVWHTVQVGQLTVANTMLEQDLCFWRKQLQQSDNLLTKAIAQSAVKRHLFYADLLKQSLPVAGYQQLIPDQWRKAFSDAELSLLLAFAGEWHFSNSAVELLLQRNTQNIIAHWFSVGWWRPFIQQQAVSNSFALRYLACAEAGANITKMSTPWYNWLYNPVGKVLTKSPVEVCGEQKQELIDLDNKRKLLLI